MSTTTSSKSLNQSANCPTCSREFASPRGMRVHHTKVHGEHLPNRHCVDCGVEFWAPNGDRTRCEDCTKPPQTSPRDPTRGNTSATCLICEAHFLYYPSESAGHYCPTCVADPDVACMEHEVQKKVVEVACTVCSESWKRFQSEAAKRTHHLCSRECYRTWLSTTQRGDGKWTGADNPNWGGGVDQEGLYGEGWPTARKRALQRDEFSCQRCGDDHEVLGQNPDVHHIRPVWTFEDPRDAHTLENLVSLCRPCHLVVEREDVRDAE